MFFLPLERENLWHLPLFHIIKLKKKSSHSLYVKSLNVSPRDISRQSGFEFRGLERKRHQKSKRTHKRNESFSPRAIAWFCSCCFLWCLRLIKIELIKWNEITRKKLKSKQQCFVKEIYEIQSMIACKVLWNSLLLICLCITLGLNVLGKSGAGKEFTEVRPQ